jgi:hypothetical protein
MFRRLGRAIFAVLIGLSVALLPATAGFAAVQDASVVKTMVDCGHHRTGPNKHVINDDACMAACALCCFGIAGTGNPGIAVSTPIGASLKPARSNDTLSSRMGSPPFRPPRS